MRVLSLFSGVGGFDMGLEAAGMKTVFQCEIDQHATSVLHYHWPEVPKWGDVSTLTGAYILEKTGGVDVVAWGSPCQDLSLAGKRKGLSGERSGLFHEGIRIIKELRELSDGKYPTWSIWENVYGALSSNRGADFGQVLHEMDEAGACFSEWAVLDAQYFGVPQRRRRVFITTCFDPAISERCPTPLLPVAESLRGDLASRRPQRKGTAGTTAESVGAGVQLGSEQPIANTISASLYHHGTVVNQDVDNGHVVVEEPVMLNFQGSKGNSITTEDGISFTLNAMHGHDVHVITDAIPIQDGRAIEKHQGGIGVGHEGDPSYTLDQTGAQSVAHEIAETEAMQASPMEPLLVDGRRNDDVRVYEEPVQTLEARMGTGGNNVPVVAQEPIVFQPGTMIRLNGGVWEGGPVPTLRAEGKSGDNEPHIAHDPTLSFDTQFGSNAAVFEDQSPTLKASQQSPSVLQENGDGYTLSGFAQYIDGVGTLKANGGDLGGGSETIVVAGVGGTDSPTQEPLAYDEYNDVLGNTHHALRAGTKQSTGVLEPTLVVRRLTPLECERLMGWPDNHTMYGTRNGDTVAVSDTNRYKMCGNGVVSPVSEWIGRILLGVTKAD